MERFISVAEAAHDFSELVNEVYSQRQTYLLTQDGVVVAKLIPPNKTLTGKELAERWPKQLPFEPGDAEGWAEELARAKTLLLSPTNAWDA